MSTTLVAGATGYLGRYIVAELHRRGHSVRAVVRHRARAEGEGPWGSPGLRGMVSEWVVGEVTDASFTRDLAAGTERIVSALGTTRQGSDPWEVDNQANRALLSSALAHGARSFTYVNVLGGDHCPAELTRAKSAFAQMLSTSTITSQIINPTAYFSDMMEIMNMAKRGLVPVLSPTTRVNPIHGSDLASFIVDHLDTDESGSWDVGGPEIFTWRELAHLALQCAGRRPRTMKVPSVLLTPTIRITGLYSPRLADIIRFMVWNMTHDCVAPTTGTHRLADFYAKNRPTAAS
ncbi:NAD(P)H-binding protein [Actinomyces slackii]|uniref:Divinyl chlorophyllide a 8-vinyl-reductase, chloroplastic n=1 Tax=Actinomyces slackii TaxID=52774 RepID=A0A448KAK4_9ACTO|nr:NAD(P)H-binding protein [Actinomyces slackii]VEG73943.1 Putative NADH-flavin reductase [Actinomyces slackii]